MQSVFWNRLDESVTFQSILSRLLPSRFVFAYSYDFPPPLKTELTVRKLIAPASQIIRLWVNMIRDPHWQVAYPPSLPRSPLSTKTSFISLLTYLSPPSPLTASIFFFFFFCLSVFHITHLSLSVSEKCRQTRRGFHRFWCRTSVNLCVGQT